MNICKIDLNSAYCDKLGADGKPIEYCGGHRGAHVNSNPYHFLTVETCCQELSNSTYNGECGVYLKEGTWWVFYDGGYKLFKINNCPYCGKRLITKREIKSSLEIIS